MDSHAQKNGEVLIPSAGEESKVEQGELRSVLLPSCVSQLTAPIILSFDVEEHDRIEAAVKLEIDADLKSHYRRRLDISTRWVLDLLGQNEIKTTFFIVGEIAKWNPRLIREIHGEGHEIASHSWSHRRIHHFTPESFAEDVRKSKDTLEQVTGEKVVGFRAPTFSIVQQTGWALDVLAESGFLYDSSIFPVRHDRYGVPKAPRRPFLARGREHSILEFPPATLRLLYSNLPVGGGGYFRLFPLFLLNWALRQIHRSSFPAIPTLYFHPWEFDPSQARLPLERLNGIRTYVGLSQNGDKLTSILRQSTFVRAVDVADWLLRQSKQLQTFSLPSC